LTALVLTSIGWFPLSGPADYFVLASTAPGPPPFGIDRAAGAVKKPTTFRLRVPPPAGPQNLEFAPLPAPEPIAQGVVFYARVVNGQPMPPLPPHLVRGPLAPFLGGLTSPRQIAPGTILTPEEVASIQAAAGPNREINITQDAEGRVTRVEMRARRLIDENPNAFFNIHLGATAPDATDRPNDVN
jgi:hypothetical protein